ncbi:MAG: hypothetical protein VX589_18385 [Myxococcota bacterium]|nr:hypothetical protein [Myxococcota bacterium]
MRIGLFILIALMSGCGPSVSRLSLTDERLPVDARRWVADAEDAVVVSGAWLADAMRSLDDANRWSQRVLEAPPFVGSLGATAQLHRSAMATAVVSERQAAQRLAQADLDLAKARRTLIYAETAMRHDIAVYNMPPLQALVDQKLQAVLVFRDQHRKARNKALAATDTWWATWQKFVAAKNDTRPFWTEAP